MGRTNMTYRDRVNGIEDDWGLFRKSLRRRHKPVFDQLFEHAANHAKSAGYQNPTDTWKGIWLSICLAQQEELNELRERVAELEQQAGE